MVVPLRINEGQHNDATVMAMPRSDKTPKDVERGPIAGGSHGPEIRCCGGATIRMGPVYSF